MEIMPDIHQIFVEYKGRPLKLYLLRFGDQSLLMDVGFNTTPDADILPYFQKLNLDPKQLTYVMLTHPDLDHVGGIHRMKELSPNAKFLCGALDQQQIETPEALADLRARAHFHYHHLGIDGEARESFIKNAGGHNKKITIDQLLNGGESLPLGNKTLQILHLPGHSHGHLGLYFPWENAAIIADAVHGTANRFIDGRAAFAPTYMYIEAYLGTISQLQAMNLDKLYSCHWPDCTTNKEVNTFLNESRTYALKAEQTILETVRAAGPAGITLKEVCLTAKPQLGDWPPEKDSETRSMACGHLQRLVANGYLNSTNSIPTRYTPEPNWLGLK